MPIDTISGAGTAILDFISEVADKTNGDFGLVESIEVDDKGKINWTAQAGEFEQVSQYTLVGDKVRSAWVGKDGALHWGDGRQERIANVKEALHKALSIEVGKCSPAQQEYINRLTDGVERAINQVVLKSETSGERRGWDPQNKSASAFVKSIAKEIEPLSIEVDDRIPDEKHRLDLCAQFVDKLPALVSRKAKESVKKEIADELSKVKLELSAQARNSESGLKGDLACVERAKASMEGLKNRLLSLDQRVVEKHVIGYVGQIIERLQGEEIFLGDSLGKAEAETKKFEPFVDKLSAVVGSLPDVEVTNSLDEAASGRLKESLDRLQSALVPRTTLNRGEIKLCLEATGEVLQSVKSSLGDSRHIAAAKTLRDDCDKACKTALSKFPGLPDPSAETEEPSPEGTTGVVVTREGLVEFLEDISKVIDSAKVYLGEEDLSESYLGELRDELTEVVGESFDGDVDSVKVRDNIGFIALTLKKLKEDLEKNKLIPNAQVEALLEDLSFAVAVINKTGIQVQQPIKKFIPEAEAKARALEFSGEVGVAPVESQVLSRSSGQRGNDERGLVRTLTPIN